MSEFTPFSPPETLYEVTAEEISKAINGLPFKQQKWFYRKTGKEIKKDKVIDIVFKDKSSLNDDSEYIVLKEAKCISSTDEIELVLNDVDQEPKAFILIFYKCILQSARLYCVLSRLDFINTLIKESLIVEGSYIGSFSIENTSNLDRIHISNSTTGTFFIRDSRIGYVEIADSSTIEHFAPHASQIGTISITDNSQTRNIFIEGESEAKDIWVSKSQIGVISINSKSKVADISIGYNSLSKDIRIEENSQGGDIRIYNNSLCGDIKIKENSKSGSIVIEDNSRSGDLLIDNSSIKQVRCDDNYCSFRAYNAIVPIMHFNRCHLHEVIWQAGTTGQLYINACYINHIELIRTAVLKDSVISIINTGAYIIQLEELLILGQFILRNIHKMPDPYIWEVAIENAEKEDQVDAKSGSEENDIYQQKQLLFKKQEEQYKEGIKKLKDSFPNRPYLLIANSSLGKTEITGCDLEGFYFQYRDSKLLEMFISGTKLPETYIYNRHQDKLLPNKELFEQKASIYNQFKRIFENQGAIVEATRYHSNAMDSHKEVLKILYKERQSTKWYAAHRWFTDEGFDLFNFRLNRVSNNHGESWRRALGFTILISLVVYSLYYISLNFYKDFSFSNTGNFIGNYFSFLDLTHRMDFMVDKNELTAFARFFDFIGRIVISYGIYQFIAAFRRHGRR